MPTSADSVGRMEFLLKLRRRGIMDAAVLRAMDEVPREYFVTAEFAEVAYADDALPIGRGEAFLLPFREAVLDHYERCADGEDDPHPLVDIFHGWLHEGRRRQSTGFAPPRNVRKNASGATEEA